MVVTTRTQTGTIEIPKYDYITLQLKGEDRSSTLTSPTSSKQPQDGRKAGVRKTNGRRLGHGPDKRRGGPKEKRRERLESLVRDIKLDGPPKPTRKGPYDDSTTFWPPIAFGEHEKEGLSPIARADLRVSQWQTILDSHMENISEPNVERHIKAQLRHAQMEREALDDDPGNHIVVNESMREQAILDRINVLQTTLASSRFEPERENIRGAIAAYESGQLAYSKKFALFWAGKMVDEAESYAEFTNDRMERLDRYADRYGPHWLWWESPLCLHPDQRITALGCQISERIPQNHGFGPYYIRQGYWKRSQMVHRMPTTDYSLRMHLPPLKAQIITTPDGKVNCGGPGPRLIFRSLLDSGASYPSLYEQDLWALGIHPGHYGAQTVINTATANGMTHRRVYEMHIEIAGNPGTVIIDPQNPVDPAYPRYIGGLCPVTLDDSGGRTGPGVDAEGHEINLRLSGLMPFLAAYSSITPGRNMILFGEDRNDVLGGHKTPATRRWLLGFDQQPKDFSHWDQFQDPMITFNHRDGLIVDQDLDQAVSELTVRPGQELRERSVLTDPRGQYLRQHGSIPPVEHVEPSARHL